MESKQSDARTAQSTSSQSTSWSEYLERISEIERSGIMYVSSEDYEFLCDMLDNDENDETIGE